MNVNDIIVQVTVAVMLIALLAVAFVWAYRRWGRFRARKQTVKSIEFCFANATSFGTSVAPIGTFSASSAVPALPGATNTRSARGL